jgi:O-succinylhomoserine sulfhydrylase
MVRCSDSNPDIPVANLDEVAIETLGVRAGQIRSAELEHSEAIFPTSSFVYASAEEAAARFAGTSPGNIYSRFVNPTVSMFEHRIAAMEGGARAVATASGMAAIMTTFFALLKVGDHLICSRSVFGTTIVLLDKYVQKFGIEVSLVDLTDYEAWAQAIRPNTRLLFVETPSNPLCEVVDVRRLARLAAQGTHPDRCLLIVDNCFCTPVLQRPLNLGADIVIHSATKYLDGQGRCLGGVVVGDHRVMEEVHGFLRSGGAAMSPFNAWVFLKGLETLGVRMRAHSESALGVAQWLDGRPEVEKVFYTGLSHHPQFELAQTQQSGGSGVLSFRLRGGKAEAWKFINGTELFSITANLGDTKSTITHPASTTHGRLSEEARARAGITDNLIRLSIGLEAIEDLVTDLERGFAALSA